MASSPLLDTMTAQIEAECELLLAEARSEAESIASEARDRAASLRSDALARAKAERGRLDGLWEQRAEAESIRSELSMKNDAVEAVLSRVDEKIREIVGGAGFGVLIEALLAEVMEAGSTGEDAVVLCPSSHVDRAKSWLASHGHGGVSVQESSELWDGVAAQDPGRHYRISNTLTGRFGRVDQSVRKHCMVSLFGSGADQGSV